MTKITEIQDRVAAVAWSPLPSHPDLIALGSKDSGGIGFDDHGGELELFDLNLTSSESSAHEPVVVGTIKTSTRFASIAWSTSPNNSFPLGIIAGGMIDGSVHIWDPHAILNGEPALLATIKEHGHGAVKALHFNTIETHMLATGGSEGQVVIVDLSNPRQPVTSLPAGAPTKGAEVTQVAWNSQVAHIVAAAGSDGLVTVWDLKSKRPWCELRADMMSISAMAWNPTEGLHLVTASVDDRNPLLKLWDLRASTTMPLATLQGHSQGILGLAWCPHDDSLLLSCGKDNRTILWDLFTLLPIADIPNEDHDTINPVTVQSASDLYGGGGVRSSQQRRYDVQWSPMKRGVVSTCSFDRKVQAHSVMGLATKCGRPPKWLKPGSGVSCGFGGTVISFSSTDKGVKISTAVEEPSLVNASTTFEMEIANMNVIDYCRVRATTAKDANDAQMWGFMQVLFETNGRAELVEHLGFHKDEIVKAAAEFTEDPRNAIEAMSLSDKPSKMTPGTEEAIKNALLVGDFAAAVECCLRTGNMADALLLASCAGGDVWTRTQERYFQAEAPHKSFLIFMGAIVANQLYDLVANSDPKNWRETLAIASTYGQSGEFPALSVALGERLEAAGDSRSASLCYMCSISLDRAVKFWLSQLKAANIKKGGTDLLAIHDFVVKVTVFLKAMDESTEIDPEISIVFAEYSRLLSEQGLLITASKYSKVISEDSILLRDRLYRSRESGYCLAALGGSPDFPFQMANISRAPADFNPANPAHSVQAAYLPQQAHSQQASLNASYTTAVAQQPTVPQTQNGGADQLADGWIALQDPSSGRTYYANQATGQTTWEMPQAAPALVAQHSQPHVQHQTQTVIHQQQPAQAMQQQVTNGTSSTPSRLASKYGDGFVTSASHPALAQQYGNVGTSNPYTGAERPGTAAAVLAPTAVGAKPPVSGTFDPAKLYDLSADLQPIKIGLLELVAQLNNSLLGPADKKQMSEGEKGIAILLKRLARGDIDPVVASKTSTMVTALRNGDFAGAASIQTSLVTSDWRENKDWLKGIKNVIQLATKKLR